MNCIEIWKPAYRFEGFYEVSSYGRVRSVDREVKCSRGDKVRLWKGKVLTPSIGATRGYLQVALSCRGVTYKVYVHKLVAETFLGSTNETVNHIDGDKLNNSINNLEWCSYSYNNKHAFSIGLKYPSGGKKVECK